jgi:UDP-N-acetyl-2-amino-2-deoxyglucuronate dehydrogenase
LKPGFSLIGCGRIGERHAALMHKEGKLLSVCDIDQERANHLGGKYNAKIYYSLADFLGADQQSDIVAVCTPNGLHAEQTISLLRGGMNVLCEKPMAISVQDCQNMMQAAEVSGKKLYIVKQNRFNPAIKSLKKVLDEGRLGKIYSLQLNCFWNRNPAYYKDSWRGTKNLDGGTLFTQFSHFIDLLYWLIGDLKEAKALLANYAHKGIIEFEDTGVVILEFENGVVGTMNYTVNSYAKNMEGSLTVFGEKGTVKVGGQYLNTLEYQDIENYVIEKLPGDSGSNDYGTYQGSMSNHDKVYENLVNSLEQKETIYMSPEDGMKTVSIIERIYKSASWING